MSQTSLDSFGAYQKAMSLFDMVVEDMQALRQDNRSCRLVAQQVGSADSICANIEEGHGRLSRKEYIRFLDMARGSARETRGRYLRMKHWLSIDTINNRTDLLDQIIGILTSTIGTLRRSEGLLKETEEEYESSPRPSTPDPQTHLPSPLDPRPSTLLPSHPLTPSLP